ncbi:MAG: hypothetical protein K2P58_03230 [Hyphomonadaceae bacterium]|nr:hypothetical protein [Hyphomonadaceae bacterium]
MNAVVEIGQNLIPTFESSDFEWYVVMSKELGHPLHIAQAAHRILTAEQRATLNSFLSAILAKLEFPARRREAFAAVQSAVL